MKRTLFFGLAALAALTITSCQKDTVLNSVPEQQPIGFGTYVGRDAQTKASVIGKKDLVGEEKGFGVFAYYTAQDTWENSKTTITPNFMYNQQVKGTYTEPNYSWNYSPLKYWPVTDGDKISFYAYAPYTTISNTPPSYNITGFSNNTAVGVPTLDFTVATEVDKQIDLLYATPITDQQQTADSLKFTFNHALSRIGFKAKPKNVGDKIQVHKITLTGKFTQTGTCKLDDGTITGNVSATDINYELNFTSTNLIEVTGDSGTEITADEGYVMIIPTTEFHSTSSISVSVNYDLMTADPALNGGFAAAVNKSETGTVSGFNFEKGKAYTLLLTISPSNPIKFAVTEGAVNGWDTDLDSNDTDDDDKPIDVDSNI